MKKLLSILIVFVFTSQIVCGQESNEEINNISLSVILPDNSEYLSRKAISKIESKIQHLVARNGISGKGYTNEFLIYPKFEIFDESTIEGMRNIVVVEAEFNLFIQQYSTKRIFSTYSKSIKGSGSSKEKAIVNAISKISANDKRVKEFITVGKNKILDYYNTNCDQIASESDYLIKTQKYQQAIAILSTVPKEAKQCYASVQDKSIEAFNAYQAQLCKTNLLKAKTAIASNNYGNALRLLSYIDVSSPCVDEVETLIADVSKKVDAREKKEWDFMMKKYEDRQHMAKYRLDTMKEIAKAYFQSKPSTVIYKSLF